MTQKYRDYFDIDPEYFPVVNQRLIDSKPDIWKKFYPHETFIDLIKSVVNMLDRKKKSPLWIEGGYGVGKSHAILTLNKLLGVEEKEVEDYFADFSDEFSIDHDLLNKFLRTRNEGKILTVHRCTSSNIHGDDGLLLAIQDSIARELKKAGYENEEINSLKDSVIRYLSDSENKKSFSVYVEGYYRTLFNGDNVDEILKKLRDYKGYELQKLMEKIFKVARERQIHVFLLEVEDLAKWITKIIKECNLKAIVFFWDEFTEYFKNNSGKYTGFQYLCELSETQPFYFVIVTHASAELFLENDKDFKKLNDRFVHLEIALPENIAFRLMGAAMSQTKEADLKKEWDNDIINDLVSITKNSRDRVKAKSKISDEELTHILPIQPYAALILKHISSVFKSNQRSMFDFIKNDEGDESRGFQWFIGAFGPEDSNPLLTVDMLWGFFYEKGKETLKQDIRSILDYYTRCVNRGLSSDEERVLKATLLLQAISESAHGDVDLFLPNNANLELAFEGADLGKGGKALKCAERLVRNGFLFKKELGKNILYSAYGNEISGVELNRLREEIDQNSTTSQLIKVNLKDVTGEETSVSKSVSFAGDLKLRYKFYPVSIDDFESVIKKLRNESEEGNNILQAVVCFAKNKQEATSLVKKIQSTISQADFSHIIFIDATSEILGDEAYSRYQNALAYSLYQMGKDDALKSQYAKNANEELKKWKLRIEEGVFSVYTKSKSSGEYVGSIDILESVLRQVVKDRFQNCLEGEYQVAPSMFELSNIPLGVECGVTRSTKLVYAQKNENLKLENALREAWNDSEYWKNKPQLLISKIKKTVDDHIVEKFRTSGNRCSIRSIYDLLKKAPYGFLPCNLTAFILGFVLKEYVGGTYSWSDETTNGSLKLDKLKEMVAGIIGYQVDPNKKYRDLFIVATTPAEKSFFKTTSDVFNVSISRCSSIEQTRDNIRYVMKQLSFPIWTTKEILSEQKLETPEEVISELIDGYVGIANTRNADSIKSENEFAKEIGSKCIEYPKACEDLKKLFTRDCCNEGMKKYLERYRNGVLVDLASEIEDGGQYINVLRSKFDADAANWVWSQETANQKIDETILEYQIVAESSRALEFSCSSFKETCNKWVEKCGYIRISFELAKNHLGSAEPFVEALYNLRKDGDLPFSRREEFLKLLRSGAEAFREFYDNQIVVFKKACSYYLNGFTDEQIENLFKKIPTSETFVMSKGDYSNLVEQTAKEYRSSLGNERLKSFWREKTGTDSPRDWSRISQIPILCVVPDAELSQARKAFETLNEDHPSDAAVKDAKVYLENATFYHVLGDQNEVDRLFVVKILKSYAVLLNDVVEVRRYLVNTVDPEPYDWFGLPEVEKKLQEMAEAKYNQVGYKKALDIIDGMNDGDVKEYLKDLVKDNMNVGIEIIKKEAE